MCNEHYQELTSLLSTNTNTYIRRAKIFLTKNWMTNALEYKTFFDDTLKKYDKIYHVSINIIDTEFSVSTETKQYKMNNAEVTKDICNNFRYKNVSHKNSITMISTPEDNLTVRRKLLGNKPTENGSSLSKLTYNEPDLKIEMKKSLTKATILNQVLQSPWTPILPYNFRPLSKQDHRVDGAELDNIHQSSDRNYNTKTCINFNPTGLRKEVFSNNATIGTQLRQHSSHYTCEECDKSFSQLRNFKYHMSVHRGTKEFAITCPVCGKYFNDRGYLSSHMKIHRNRKEYKCNLCPKSFNQRVAYNMHVRIHTGVKPHVCDDCGKAFSRKMLLKQHQRTHSGERPYACSYCDKRFADRSNMTLHLRLHTGVKPFACNLCPKAFSKKHHLKSHLNFHTGAKPYTCPSCKLAFTQSSNMRTHYKKCNTQPANKDI